MKDSMQWSAIKTWAKLRSSWFQTQDLMIWSWEPYSLGHPDTSKYVKYLYDLCIVEQYRLAGHDFTIMSFTVQIYKYISFPTVNLLYWVLVWNIRVIVRYFVVSSTETAETDVNRKLVSKH